jgi:hypothetical protein
VTLSEASMYPPLGRFLLRNGYEIGYQVRPRLGSQRIYDVVGIKPRRKEAAVIEAKLDHFHRAYDQAALRLFVADYVYVSFPLSYATAVMHAHSRQFRADGIGLLGLNRAGVRQLIAPRLSQCVSAVRRGTLIDVMRGSARNYGQALLPVKSHS